MMTVFDAKAEADALETCEQEPIRSPDRIQPHGCLIVSDMSLGAITHVSENTADMLGLAPDKILGQRLDSLLSTEDAHDLRNSLSVGSILRQREYLGRMRIGSGDMQAAVHVKNDHVFLEMTPDVKTSETTTFGLDRLRWLMGRRGYTSNVCSALNTMTKDLQNIIGYDRVMAYQFRPDGSGEIIAEQIAPGMDSFLGLRFPEQDIPKIARAICLEQPVRIIADINSADVPVLTTSTETQPLDMTLAELRGTSPVHISYLKNMGVGASLVLPIIVDGALWGLFSCHHRTPRVLAIEETIIFELVGQMLNVSIDMIIRRDLAEKSAKCTQIVRMLGKETAAIADTIFTDESWGRFAEEIMPMFNCDGVLVQHGEMMNAYGVTPPIDVLPTLDAELVESTIKGIFTHASLAKVDGGYAKVAGMMRIDLFPERNVGFWVFRREENEVVRWAGSPEKEIEQTATSSRLHPRSSFKAYSKMSEGSSRAWTPEDALLGQALQAALVHAFKLQFERNQNEVRLGLMVQELNHRVRNILALIQSVASQSRTGDQKVEEYAETMGKRLLAVASAHDLLTEADNAGLDIKAMITQELQPYPVQVANLSGPTVHLSPSASTLFALVFHEIITNAVKYGGLSVADGTVDLNWVIHDQMLTLCWTERGVPQHETPQKAGFGDFLIQQGIGHQLGGSSSTVFSPGRVEITLRIPAKHLIKAKPVNSVTTIVDTAETKTASHLETLTNVLVLEDDFLIATDIKDFLLGEGVKDITLIGSNDAAIDAIGQTRPECALVDLNLGMEDSRKTAIHLHAQGIPFLFLTGYSKGYGWIDDFPNSPLVNKPIRPDKLRASLEHLLATAKGE